MIDITENPRHKLFTPLHMTGYFSNSYYYYTEDLVKDISHARNTSLNCMELLNPNMHLQPHITSMSQKIIEIGEGFL